VLELCRRQYYRWLHKPFTDAELDEAWLANAIYDAHVDDPEFGYRFLANEVRAGGHDVGDRTVWRICSENGWWCSFGKPRRNRKATRSATDAHDDLVRRQFKAAGQLVRLWPGELTVDQIRCSSDLGPVLEPALSTANRLNQRFAEAG